MSPLLKTRSLLDYCINDADLSRLKNLPQKEYLRLFALLYNTSFNLQKTLDTLKCSNQFKDYSLKMASLLSQEAISDKIALKKALNLADYDVLLDALNYKKAVLGVDISAPLALVSEIKNNNEPYKISQLNITGNDIISLGFSGKQVGQKLEFLLDEVIKNPELNKREKLINLICN